MTAVFAPTQGNRTQGPMRALLERELDARDGARVCFYCNADLDPWRCPRIPWAIDHVTAKRRSGSDSIENLVWACRDCNLLKGDCPGWFFVFWREARA